MHALIELLLAVLSFYEWVVIAAAIMSNLVAFGVINRYNRVVVMIGDALYRMTEPALQPIRRILPDLGGLDLSPLVLLFLLWFVQNLIAYDLAPILLGY